MNTGCVRRTISIATQPPGALVWLNDREIGRTPIEVDFLYYGTYDVRLELDGYEPMMTSGKVDAPLWDVVGVDLISELMPLDLESRAEWTYTMVPTMSDEAGLIQRAREMRISATAADEGQKVPKNGPEGP